MKNSRCRWGKSPRMTQIARMETMKELKVVLEPSEQGGFTVYVPSMLGCISEGETREEALENIKEAIALYSESPEKGF